MRTGGWSDLWGTAVRGVPLRRVAPLLAVAALLGAAALASALATPQITSVPVPHSTGAPAPAPSGGRPPSFAAPTPPGAVQRQASLPPWVTTLVSALCIAVVAAVVALIVWKLLRDAARLRGGRLPQDDGAADPAVSREQVLAAVDAGLSDLDAADADPRRAVIACWVRLEEAAAAVGTMRQPGDSPTDLVLRLLAAHQVSAPLLYALAELYQLARYATHAVDGGMRDRARSALHQLRAELADQPAMGSSR